MGEQTYERTVDQLEDRYAKSIASTARAAVEAHSSTDLDEIHEQAYDAVFNSLIEDAAWEPVEAADISDIAHDAAHAAIREYLEDHHSACGTRIVSERETGRRMCPRCLVYL